MKLSPLLLTWLFMTDASAQVVPSEILSIISPFVTSFFGITSTSGLDASATSSEGVGQVSPFSSTFSVITATSSTRSSTASRSRTSASAASVSTSLPTSTSSSATITSQTSGSGTSSDVTSTAPSGVAAGASATSAAPNSGSNGSNHDRNLAIILGTVLGALALGLLILLLVILCGRRRRRRHAARSASLASSSDEALAGHKSRVPVAPLAGGLASRKSRSHDRRSGSGMPLMAERSNVSVPSAHTFHDSSTTPFLPGASDGKRSSGILANHNSGGLAGDGFEHAPRNNHHTGGILAAGAGGAALGAAAAKRHSRSNERHYDQRQSGEHETHPSFWNEPPPRSPHRNSGDSFARRSGSMPRTFYGPQDNTHNHSPLRNGTSGAAAGVLAGGAAGALAGSHGRRSHDRGRALHSEPTSHHLTSPTMNGSPGTNGRRVPSGPAAVGAGPTNYNNSPSRSRSRPPLPPSLVIPNPNAQRNAPGHGSNQNRFTPNGAYQDPATFDDRRIGGNTAAPRRPTHTDSWQSFGSPDLADDLVSPVSPQDTTRHSNRHMPIITAGPNAINHTRSRSISPPPPGPPQGQLDPTPPSPILSPSTATTSHPNVNTMAAPNHRKQHSGLLNAVQGHFNQDSVANGAQPQNRGYQNYSAMGPGRHSAFSPNDNSNTIKPPGPISRKPLPTSVYNGAGLSSHPPGYTPANGNTRWRSEEDSAWAQSYSGVGQAR